MIIYLVTNRINGKIYVGQTTHSIKVRWKYHISRAIRSTAKMVLYDAIRKYGPESFTIEEIDQAKSHEELNKLEIYYIKRLNATVSGVGYNISEGGNSAITEVTKAKISATLMGRSLPQSQKDAISLAMKGRTFFSEEHRHKISKALEGRPLSVNARNKISNTQKGRFLTPEQRAKISAKVKGIPLTSAHKAKISEAQKGRTVPQERRNAISVALKGKPWSEKRRIAQENKQ